MYSISIFNEKRNPEGGFVLIAAIMAILIIVAVGFFALTVTTQDIRISSRLLGERKAMSAAEACVHELCRELNPFNLSAVSSSSVDPINDPHTAFSSTVPARREDIPQMNLPGYDMAKAYVGALYNTTCTGTDTSPGRASEVSIAIGTVFAPNPGDTTYDQP
jgi:Tfp pilus assembly protein PilX